MMNKEALATMNPRLVEVFDAAANALRKVVVDHHVTHQEYCQMVEFLNTVAAGGEINLICDLILEAAVMEAHFASSRGTAFNAEGPYYLPDAPRLTLPYTMPMRADEVGPPMVFSGTVKALDGAPLAGASIELWHSTVDGLYSNIDPEVPEWLFRGQFTTSEDGAFDVRSIQPSPYEISRHGPVGRMLKAMGRHQFRPAHLHFKVSHAGFEPLTTQIYFNTDPYLDSDAANCVHKSLVIELNEVADALDIEKSSIDGPFVAGHYEFVLSPSA
ncbi:Chlorocatechol 1,2-dioxygenase (plasmid) [Variovorax sp. SRS16]|uniref:dioxygenase family protein n=1 Tax=Variovorax sp. SRS16 TaxID=282217 RepID=UPI0013192709|nr:dioxygenase [Variovorax sp. SRS16]VTU46694.1 Chlorocatechol 1,2-dioxygenase [Variovorax sp. SRS16]